LLVVAIGPDMMDLHSFNGPLIDQGCPISRQSQMTPNDGAFPSPTGHQASPWSPAEAVTRGVQGSGSPGESPAEPGISGQ